MLVLELFGQELSAAANCLNTCYGFLRGDKIMKRQYRHPYFVIYFTKFKYGKSPNLLTKVKKVLLQWLAGIGLYAPRSVL
jgi:hypothetical protein